MDRDKERIQLVGISATARGHGGRVAGGHRASHSGSSGVTISLRLHDRVEEVALLEEQYSELHEHPRRGQTVLGESRPIAENLHELFDLQRGGSEQHVGFICGREFVRNAGH